MSFECEGINIIQNKNILALLLYSYLQPLGRNKPPTKPATHLNNVKYSIKYTPYRKQSQLQRPSLLTLFKKTNAAYSEKRPKQKCIRLAKIMQCFGFPGSGLCIN